MRLSLTYYWQKPLDNPMARIFWGRVPIERVAAHCFYLPDTQLATAVHAMKYHNRPDVAEAFGRKMANYWTESGFFDGIDAIVPVPLSRSRMRQRGYNQSHRIAVGIAEITGLPVYNKVLERTDFHGSQTRLNAYERQDNVSDAFRLADPCGLAGHHVLLIDDIMTTGSTLLACAEQLHLIPNLTLSIATFGITER
jgi:ComF family protein